MEKHKEYRPSPSQLGTCQRRLAYWASGMPFELNPLSELRARRGQAIHLIIQDVLEYVLTHDPQFLGVTYEVLKQEHELTFPEDWGMVGGTPDLVVRLYWQNQNRAENAVIDLKNYKSIPIEPYESNVWQMQVYIEAENADCGYILYFPDSGEPRMFRVSRDPGIIQFAREYFGLVEKSLAANALPDRIDYHDMRCSYCPFWDTCWGDLAAQMGDSWKKQNPILFEELPAEVQAAALNIVSSRAALKLHKDLEQKHFDALVKHMTKEGIFSIKYGTGEVYALQWTTKKDGSGYFSYKRISGA